MAKRALITGVTGQDGSYLAEFSAGEGLRGAWHQAAGLVVQHQRVDHIYQDPHVAQQNFVLHYGGPDGFVEPHADHQRGASPRGPTTSVRRVTWR